MSQIETRPRPPDPRQPRATRPSRSSSCCAPAPPAAPRCPSGASTGEFEATELRDGGDACGGKGVTQAVAQRQRRDRRRRSPAATRPTRPALDRALIELDGTPNKSRLGANAILGVSLAAAHAAAAEEGLPLWRYLGGEAAHVLPVPMMNVLNGGAHADNKVDFQEFMVVPAGAESFAECLRMGAEVFHALKKTLHDAGLGDGRRRRGRLRARPRLQRGGAADARRGHRGGGLHARRGRRDRARPGDERDLRRRRLRARARGPHADAPTSWPPTGPSSPARYPIVSIEDGMDEEDWDGWKTLTERLGDTRPARRRRPLRHEHRAPAARHRPRRRQLDPDQGQPDRHADRDARRDRAWRATAGYTAVMSHRSGETEDVTIADLAVATGCGQIKTGAPSRSDRVAKYNQLLRIEEALGDDADVPGPLACFRSLDTIACTRQEARPRGANAAGNGRRPQHRSQRTRRPPRREADGAPEGPRRAVRAASAGTASGAWRCWRSSSGSSASTSGPARSYWSTRQRGRQPQRAEVAAAAARARAPARPPRRAARRGRARARGAPPRHGAPGRARLRASSGLPEGSREPVTSLRWP